MKIISKNINDTQNIAKKIAPQLKNGDILLLLGDLGAGKTTFTKELCKCLGVEEKVTSPTFTLLNEYKGDLNINHFDLYRIEDVRETYEFGFFDIINSHDAVNIIEWPQIVLDLLPSNLIKISITRLDENNREFDIQGVDL